MGYDRPMSNPWVERARKLSPSQIADVVETLPDDALKDYLAAFRGKKLYRAVALRAAMRGPGAAPALLPGLGLADPSDAIALGVMGNEATAALESVNVGAQRALAKSRLDALLALPEARNGLLGLRYGFAWQDRELSWMSPPPVLATRTDGLVTTTCAPCEDAFVRLDGRLAGTVVELRPELHARFGAEGIELEEHGAIVKRAPVPLEQEGWASFDLSGAYLMISTHASPPYYGADVQRTAGAVSVRIGDPNVRIRIQDNADRDLARAIVQLLSAGKPTDIKRAQRELQGMATPPATRALRIARAFLDEDAKATKARSKEKPLASDATIEQRAESLGFSPAKGKGCYRKGRSLELRLGGDKPASLDALAAQIIDGSLPRKLLGGDGAPVLFGVEQTGVSWLSVASVDGTSEHLFVVTERDGRALRLSGPRDAVDETVEALFGVAPPLDDAWRQLDFL